MTGTKLNAAELLARVRKRKQELQEQTQAQNVTRDAPPSKPKQQKKNPYIDESGVAQLAAAKPRLALSPRVHQVKIADETELLYFPAMAPPSDKEWWDEVPLNFSNKVLRPGRRRRPEKQELGAEIHLTTAERRRRRKQNRLAKQHDIQERVRLGIDPAPPPKLKLSNVASVFGPAFVHDPTRYEELARQAEAERREAHEQANKERELTPEQRWAKHEAKMEAHRSQNLSSAAFRVEQLDEETGKPRFLVDYTAKKFKLTGVALLGSPALVIVEGGEPEIAKFTKLLARKVAKCTLLWTGALLQPNFKLWSLHKFPSEMLKREFLKNHHALPYYLLMQDAPLSEV